MIRSELFLKGFSSVFWRSLGVISVFFLQVVVSRSLSQSEAGLFFIAMSALLIFATIVRVGVDAKVVRETSEFQVTGDDNGLKRLYAESNILVLVCSVFVGIIVYLSSGWLSVILFGDRASRFVMELVAITIVPAALVFVHGSFFQGLKNPMWMQLSHGLSPAVILLALIVLTAGFRELEISFLLVLFGLSYLFSLMLSCLKWMSDQSPAFPASNQLTAMPGAKSINFVLWGVSVLTVLMNWITVLMVGILESPKESAVFANAYRVSLIVVFFSHAINAILAPMLAKAVLLDEKRQQERLAFSSIFLSLIVSLPVTVFLYVFAVDVMLVFGEEFGSGATILRVLLIGQLFSLLVGPVGWFLLVAKSELLLLVSQAIAVLIIVIGSLVTVGFYGIEAAAIAHTVGFVAFSLMNYYWIHRKFGVNFYRSMSGIRFSYRVSGF